LIFIPAVTHWLETGELPRTPREMVSDIVLSLNQLVCAWIIVRQARRLENNALADSLTGLLNSRKLQQDLPDEVARAKRFKSPLALAYMDLDNFKGINDAHDNAAGDDVLRRFSDLLRRTARRTDRCYRVGGDEFVILMPATAVEGARELLDRLRASALREPVELDRFGSSLSVGVVELRDVESPEDFLRRADHLMYESKNGGKNRVKV
jgi:diguanylate cyclase (GGDEF)-like protein